MKACLRAKIMGYRVQLKTLPGTCLFWLCTITGLYIWRINFSFHKWMMITSILINNDCHCCSCICIERKETAQSENSINNTLWICIHMQKKVSYHIECILIHPSLNHQSNRLQFIQLLHRTCVPSTQLYVWNTKPALMIPFLRIAQLTTTAVDLAHDSQGTPQIFA